MSVTVKCGDSSVTVDKAGLDAAGGRLQFSGELCPVSSSSLQVLFVLDFSGSMQTSDPVVGSGASGTCGRSKAVQAITERLTASRGKDDKVSAGVIAFGTDTQDVTAEVDLAQFKPSAESLCRNNGGMTNYKAAFELAGRKLAASQKQTKIVYFISDGLPTAGGTTVIPGIINPFDPIGTMNAMTAAAAINSDVHFRAGADAAAVLRSSFPAMVLNAILLQPGAMTSPVDPAAYLGVVTGDAARVRIVTQANQLADGAVQLLAVPVALDAGKVEAAVSTADGARQTLTVRQLVQSQESKGKWIFATSDIDARKMAGPDYAGVLNFAMDAPESSGRKHSIQFTIKMH